VEASVPREEASLSLILFRSPAQRLGARQRRTVSVAPAGDMQGPGCEARRQVLGQDLQGGSDPVNLVAPKRKDVDMGQGMAISACLGEDVTSLPPSITSG
jgi:hypothetical protein